MATAYPIETGNKDNYELELSRVRENIKTKFVELIDCLKARESELLRDLDNILASYLSYRSELEKVNEEKMEFKEMIIFHQNKLQSSHLKAVQENIITQLNTGLKSIETPIEPKMVSFECYSNKVLAELSKLGKFVEKVGSGIDYKSKKEPLVSVCKKGNGMEQLSNPLGVTFDIKTGNIYIADQSNNCVKVFDSTGKYLFKFVDNKGEGKMCYPRGVAIYEDRILITRCYNYILNYQLNGKFISRIGRQGRGELEFYYLYSLTIDESNGDIYICDFNNNRIQILNSDFSSSLSLGKIYSNTLVMLNSPKNTFMFLMHLILVSISTTIITFYRRMLYLEAKEWKLLILISSSLTKLRILSFQIVALTLFIFSILNSN